MDDVIAAMNNSEQVVIKQEQSIEEKLFTGKSKRQLKREKKLEKRKRLKPEKRKLYKIRRKERRAKNGIPVETHNDGTLKLKRVMVSESDNQFNIVIDFSYDDLMNVKDLKNCANQAVRCYSANRKSQSPLKLHFCKFSGKIQEEMGKAYEYKRFDVLFHEDSYLDVFTKESLVYLTSESDNVIDELDPGKVYIIGGLVDHNSHKGASYRKAIQEGISHGQLPLKKYVRLKTRSVLTINHVFEILLRLSNGDSWITALKNSIPSRAVDFFYNTDDVLKSTDSQEENKVYVDNNAPLKD